MGTWNTDSFGNDGACDWAEGLSKTGGLSHIENAINKVLGTGNGYLDASCAEEAIAAAEVIAMLKANKAAPKSFPDPVRRWMEENRTGPSPELVSKARKALDRIMTEPSELLELWSESPELESWKKNIHNLKSRLS